MDLETRIREKLYVTKEDIKEGLRQLGIQENDIVMFHSSLNSMGYVKGGAGTVIDSFLETVGKGGTVVVPTCVAKVNGRRASVEERIKAWDINKSPSDVGFITETFRKRSDSIRSDNPCENVSAIGKLAREITEGHKTAYGRWSPWGEAAYGIGCPWEKLYEYDTKYMFLGVDFNVCTMFHYVQTVFLEDYLKKIDKEAQWPEFDFEVMGRELGERGLVKFRRIGEATTKLIKSKKMVDASLELLKDNFELYW